MSRPEDETSVPIVARQPVPLHELEKESNNESNTGLTKKPEEPLTKESDEPEELPSSVGKGFLVKTIGIGAVVVLLGASLLGYIVFKKYRD